MVSAKRRYLFAAPMLAAAIWIAPNLTAAGSQGAAPTLEIGWIAREPRLRAPATLTGPQTDGWPAEGSVVQWVGHVLNRGRDSVEGVSYSWRIDGAEERRGVVDLVPGDTEIVLPWRWTLMRHQIELAIAAPDGRDNSTDDNQIAIDSDALSIAFYIDRTQYSMLIGSYLGSFERRMQRQIPYWNSVLAEAAYPSTPVGALDRLRLDRVEVVPDGTLVPDDAFYEADMVWRFPVGAFFGGPYDADQTIILHELLHQRGLVDIYAYEVVHYFATGLNYGNVNTLENGKPVVGTSLMPALYDSRNVGGIFVFQTPVYGLMGSNYYRGSAVLTEVCANGLNLWHHRRTPVGRSPSGAGITLPIKFAQDGYVNRLPSETALTFTDGVTTIKGGVVDVFLDQNGHPYRDTYSADPQMTLSMDDDGVALLPADVLRDQPPFQQAPKAQTMLFRVRTNAARAYVFVPVWDFNRLYFREGGRPAALQVPVKMIRY